MLPLDERILVLEVSADSAQARTDVLRKVLNTFETIAQSPPEGVSFKSGTLRVGRFDDRRWLHFSFKDNFLHDASEWTVSVQIITTDLLAVANESPGQVVFRLRGAIWSEPDGERRRIERRDFDQRWDKVKQDFRKIWRTVEQDFEGKVRIISII